MHARMIAKLSHAEPSDLEARARTADLTVQGQHTATAPIGVSADVRLTVQQAAAEAAVSVHTIRRGYENRHLRVQRFGIGGRGIRIRRADLAAWIENGGRTDVRERR
jgi:excisionase family DNA binding protein